MPQDTTYLDATADSIIERMSDGQSLREICKDPEMPALRTVFNWLRANPEFANAYARAQDVRADTLFDEMLEIADDGTNDWTERQQGDDVVKVVDHEHIARSRLRVDARKWILAKMSPKKYGDKQIIEATSDVTVHEPDFDASKLSREERQLLRELLKKAEPTPIEHGSGADRVGRH